MSAASGSTRKTYLGKRSAPYVSYRKNKKRRTKKKSPIEDDCASASSSSMKRTMKYALVKCPSMGPVGFPDCMLQAYKYAWYGTLSPSVGVPAYNDFRANSPYDPDWSGVGASANLFTVLNNVDLYTRHCCYAVDYKITFQNPSNQPYQCCVRFVPDTVSVVNYASPAEMYDGRETRWTDWALLNRNELETSVVNMKGTVKLADLFGVKRGDIYAEDNYSGGYNYAPGFQGVIQTVVSPVPQGGSDQDINVYVELVYHCKLYALSNRFS